MIYDECLRGMQFTSVSKQSQKMKQRHISANFSASLQCTYEFYTALKLLSSHWLPYSSTQSLYFLRPDTHAANTFLLKRVWPFHPFIVSRAALCEKGLAWRSFRQWQWHADWQNFFALEVGEGVPFPIDWEATEPKDFLQDSELACGTPGKHSRLLILCGFWPVVYHHSAAGRQQSLG